MYLEKIKPNFLDKNNKISASRMLWFFRKNPIEKQHLITLTLDCIGDENFAERLFWIANNLTDYLTCANPNCNEQLKGITRWENKKSDNIWSKNNHRLTCSNNCKHELHHSRTEEVNKNRKITFQTKYGVDNVAQLDTNLFKANNPMKNSQVSRDKNKATCLTKYGVDNVSKSKVIIGKIKKKANRPLEEQLEINEKRKNTCLSKYGVEFTMQVEENRLKSKETFMRKYGVSHNSQVPKFFDKITKSGYSAKDYTFPSGKVVRIRGYEWKALDELLQIYGESELEVSAKIIPRIKYLWDDETEHYYFPDIFIEKDNLIIEVKSDYYMRKDFRKNMLKAVATKKEGYNFKFMVYTGKD